MLLRLGRPVRRIKPVSLNFNASVPIDDTPVTAVGLGVRRQGMRPVFLLNEVRLNAIGYENCTGGEDHDWNTDIIVDKHMQCAGRWGGAICSGDSGGPLIVKGRRANEDVQVGTASFTGRICWYWRYPSVFIKTSGHEAWVKETICTESEVPPSFCGE
mmetsp:Transcript_32280/g.49356  ORF Transcript_32280/g.49356 Transcript_32280/m.49356 type:complete len:158 (+) Transcript_32280:166-639(+)